MYMPVLLLLMQFKTIFYCYQCKVKEMNCAMDVHICTIEAGSDFNYTRI